MRILLVQCHPSAESFGASVAETVRRTLADGGHELRVTDLYASRFDPVMLEPEWLRYNDAELNRAPVESHVDDILWAVFVVLQRNGARGADRFGLPPERTLEIGYRIAVGGG